MRSATAPVVLAVAAAALVSCHTITEDLPSHPSPVQVGGPGSIPVIVIPVPEQTPLPVVPSPSSPIAPSPNPRPTATPDSGGGEPPVTNTSPVVKLNAHVYFIECDGAPVPGSGGADSGPVGCRIHFDCTARDSTNSPTVPRGNPVWTYSNPGLVNGGNTGFNPVVIAKAPGCFNYYAEVDGVRSGTSGFCIH
jgi:hypothetical protein